MSRIERSGYTGGLPDGGAPWSAICEAGNRRLGQSTTGYDPTIVVDAVIRQADIGFGKYPENLVPCQRNAA